MSEALSAFTDRIIGMMADYKISMSDALMWDFEATGVDIARTMREMGEFAEVMIQDEFILYLLQNGLEDGEGQYFLNVFMGIENDMILREDAESENEQKGKT